MFLGYTLNGFHKLKAAHKSAFSVWVNQKTAARHTCLPGLLLGLWARFLYMGLDGLNEPVYSLAGTWANCIRRIVFHFKCCEISNVYGQRISKFLPACVSVCVYVWGYGRGTIETCSTSCTVLHVFAAKMAAKRAITWRFSSLTWHFLADTAAISHLHLYPHPPAGYLRLSPSCKHATAACKHGKENKTTIRC